MAMVFGTFLLPHDSTYIPFWREDMLMNQRSIDILVVTILTSIAVVLTFTVSPDSVPVRILSLPLVLVLPGYALLAALFPRQVFGLPVYLVFSLGLSLAIVILGGLVLNLTPFGLRASSWVVFLSCITLGACAVALLRRRGQSLSTRWLGVGPIGLTFRQGLLLALAALILCGAVAMSIIGAEQQPRPGFTQLWILPVSGASHAKNVVRLGVSNKESKATGYRLSVNINGKVVKEWRSLDLNSNEKWEVTLVLPQSGHIGTARVEAMLYRTDTPTTVYRHVVLWLDT